MEKNEIKVIFQDIKQYKKEFNLNSLLIDIRKDLKNDLNFPFHFSDLNGDEIPEEKESQLKLIDILDLRLFIKREYTKRDMLGTKIQTLNDLDFYLYPKINFSNKEKETSSNILIIGETGAGKSAWAHCLLNYLEDIQLDEINRYYLFDEKSLEVEYEKKHGKKPLVGIITDKISIYNIQNNKLVNKKIRVIDTPGFGDSRGLIYDEKKEMDLGHLFEGEEIINIKAVCLFFKAMNYRLTERLKKIMNQLFSLFGEDIKNNIIIIFTFCDNFKDIQFLKTLKNENFLFFGLLGNIDKIPYFCFNNSLYFRSDRVNIEQSFEINKKNFENLFKYFSTLNDVSLKSSGKVVYLRKYIKNNLINLLDELALIELYKTSIIDLQKKITKNNDRKNCEIPHKVKEQYEETEKQDEELKKLNKDLSDINKEIDCSINNLTQKFYQIILKYNELNSIALKKDTIKFEYIFDILKEVENNNKRKILELFWAIAKLDSNFIDQKDISNLIQSYYSLKKINDI